jgi:hypothetical protein
LGIVVHLSRLFGLSDTGLPVNEASVMSSTKYCALFGLSYDDKRFSSAFRSSIDAAKAARAFLNEGTIASVMCVWALLFNVDKKDLTLVRYRAVVVGGMMQLSPCPAQ